MWPYPCTGTSWEGDQGLKVSWRPGFYRRCGCTPVPGPRGKGTRVLKSLGGQGSIEGVAVPLYRDLVGRGPGSSKSLLVARVLKFYRRCGRTPVPGPRGKGTRVLKSLGGQGSIEGVAVPLYRDLVGRGHRSKSLLVARVL